MITNMQKFSDGKRDTVNKIHLAFQKFTDEKRDEMTNQRVSKDFWQMKNTAVQGNTLTRAPLTDESFMSHTVPQMNLYEYKKKDLKLKTKFVTTENKECQTDGESDTGFIKRSFLRFSAVTPEESKVVTNCGEEPSPNVVVPDPFGLDSLQIVCGKCMKLRPPTSDKCMTCL